MVRDSFRVSTLAIACALLAGAPRAAAASSKDECVDAHGKGQDAKEAGQLTQASKLFLQCAQAWCPALLQGDCARLADEVDRLTPTVTFAARDGSQNDLVDASVFVDGALVTSRLGDGKAFPVDPGRHQVRFVHGAKDLVLNVVVNQGEKGRTLLGAFATPATKSEASSAGPPRPPEPTRPLRPLLLTGLGAATTIAGGIVLGVGLAKVPSNCSIATKQCAAPPNDPVFATASSAVTLVNVGSIIAGTGLVAGVAGAILYYSQPRRMPSDAAPVVGFSPWFAPTGAGASFSTRF